MAIGIRDSEVEKMARSPASRRGTTITNVVKEALIELKKEGTLGTGRVGFVGSVMEISRRCGRLQILDARSADEILGYEARGAFDGD